MIRPPLPKAPILSGGNEGDAGGEQGFPAKSRDFFAFRDLTEPKKRPNQLPLTAHDQLRKALEPFSVRDFGGSFQPGREEFELKDGNLSLVDAEP